MEEIALDGEQGEQSLSSTSSFIRVDALTKSLSILELIVCVSGTPLERLWQFVHEFHVRNASPESTPGEIDPKLKKRLWKYLLMHKEVILKAGNELLHPDVNAAGSSHILVSMICFSYSDDA